MRTPGKAVALASLLLGTAAAADVTVREEVEPGPVGVGAPIQVRVAVHGAQGPVQARLPNGDFQLLGTSRSSSIEMRTGAAGMETSRNEQFTFTVAARAPGELTIPAARVTADGDTLSGQQVQVEVQAGRVAREAPRDDQDDPDPFASMRRQMRSFGLNDPFMQRLMDGDPFADQGAGDAPAPVRAGDVRLVATSDRKTATVGEQVTISYYLVTRVPLSGVSDLQIPAIDGAATRPFELAKHLTPEEQGDEVRVLVARRAVFPDEAGRLVIKPATARVTAGSLVGGQELSVVSPPLSVTVTALPPGPTPVAVGSWVLSLTGPATVRTGEPATIQVSAKGIGDLDGLPSPELRVPSEWKVFPSTTQEQPRVTAGLVGGTRTWDFVVLPAGEGDATLDPIHLATFDPRTRTYATTSSSTLSLHVDPMPPAPRAAPPATSAATLVPPAKLPAEAGWAVAAALLAALLVRWAWCTLRARAGGARVAPAQPGKGAARGYLEEARAFCAAAQAGPFFEALTRALDGLVTDLGAAPQADASAVAAELREKGVSPPATEVIQRAIETCRRFAFVRADDVATLRRTLGLADQAFGALGERTH